MPSAASLKFLEELMLSSGPSGFEERTAKVFRAYISKHCDKVQTDITGNTIGVINPKAAFKVMLAGHYDEIGFQVVHVTDEGLIYFRAVGGIDKLTVPGCEVEILTENGKIPGVIGKKPIHLQKEKERNEALELTDMWIDIGAESKKEVLKTVAIGDPVAIKPNFAILGKHRMMSKGLDDKVGAFVVAETLRELSRRKVKVGVYGVGTVQEELGLRGATTSAFSVNPNVGFAIDVGFTTDVPNVEKKILGEISLGKGPKLSRNADNNPVLYKRLTQTAKRHKIPYQETPGHRASGGTDTATMQMSRGGVATALIGVPNRYMHTPVEMCDLRDVDNCVRLLVETIASFTGNESFIPILK